MDDSKKLASMIKDIKFTMLTTLGADGSLYSRPMVAQNVDPEEFDGRLWFFTRADSPKVASIEKDQHVNLAYADPDNQRYVSVAGTASISRDRAMMERLWNPMLKAWFPDGLEDDQIALIRVDVASAEIWDSPPSKVIQLAGFVKAAVTGEPMHGDRFNKMIHLDRPEGRQ
jgi:general stress protein 26